MAGKTETLLLQVIDRVTRKPLLDLIEREVERRELELDFALEDRVKRSYLADIDRQVAHVPSVRAKLTGHSWVIDCAIA